MFWTIPTNATCIGVTLTVLFSTVGGVTTLLLLLPLIGLSIDNVDVDDWRRLISTPGKSHGIWFVILLVMVCCFDQYNTR